MLVFFDLLPYFFCRIQSVVCDTAYRTSENMLVCAPTGAGKTNVAMLCITQTIKQGGHFVQIMAGLREVFQYL